MNWLKMAVAELFSLFIDDVWFSFSIGVWIAFAALELPRIDGLGEWQGVILFSGLAVILVASSWRAARQK